MSATLVESSSSKPLCSSNLCVEDMALSPEAELSVVACELSIRVPVVGAYSPALRREASVRGVLKFALRSVCPRYGAVPASPLSVRTVEWHWNGVASPKLVVSPALQSVKRAARAKKVARIARRFGRIAEDHKRQQM